MGDVIFIVATLALFGVGWLYVLACDRIVSRGMTVVEGGLDDASVESGDVEVAA